MTFEIERASSYYAWTSDRVRSRRPVSIRLMRRDWLRSTRPSQLRVRRPGRPRSRRSANTKDMCGQGHREDATGEMPSGQTTSSRRGQAAAVSGLGTACIAKVGALESRKYSSRGYCAKCSRRVQRLLHWSRSGAESGHADLHRAAGAMGEETDTIRHPMPRKLEASGKGPLHRWLTRRHLAVVDPRRLRRPSLSHHRGTL